MANQIIVVALVFFAAVGMAAASASAPSTAPAAAAEAKPSLAPTVASAGSSSSSLAEGPTSESSGSSTIGSISGGSASDAAPVGGPVPYGVFADLAPALAPPAPDAGAAAALEVTAIAGTIAVVGSIFFL